MLVAAIANPGVQTLPRLAVAALVGLYARYLHRGGRIVVWLF
jgi:hypothetical protein